MIAIALPILSESEIPLIQGIREGLKSGKHENLVISGGYEGVLRKLSGQKKLTGIIGEFVSAAWLDSVELGGIPLVQLGAGASGRVPSVATDWNLLGEVAAQNLFEEGIRSAAYLGAPGPHDAGRIGDAFERACDGLGIAVTRCAESSPAAITHFLSLLPRPAGMLCASDRLARIALLAASSAGLAIPRDLAVIGVGNARLEALGAGMEISSFEIPLGEIGKRAGGLMADLLGKTAGKRGAVKGWRIVLPPRLHVRESSMRSGSGVRRALAWLNSHPESPVTAGELARHAGMSRRSFEMAVRGSQGCPPGEMLKRMRRARAERLLRETSLGIAAIGKECGYPELAVFSAAFRRWTGMSPRTFRSHSSGMGSGTVG